jgi:hypothetical protein
MLQPATSKAQTASQPPASALKATTRPNYFWGGKPHRRLQFGSVGGAIFRNDKRTNTDE